jgi:hypothetical protein
MHRCAGDSAGSNGQADNHQGAVNSAIQIIQQYGDSVVEGRSSNNFGRTEDNLDSQLRARKFSKLGPLIVGRTNRNIQVNGFFYDRHLWNL